MAIFYQRFDYKLGESVRLGTTHISPQEIASRLVQEGYAVRFSAEDLDGFPKAIVVVGKKPRDIVPDFCRISGRVSSLYRAGVSSSRVEEIIADGTEFF